MIIIECHLYIYAYWTLNLNFSLVFVMNIIATFPAPTYSLLELWEDILGFSEMYIKNLS